MNKRIKIAFILVAVILVSTLVISLAYSKYFSQYTGSGNAVVAKWSFKVTEAGEGTSFGPISLADTSNTKVKSGKIAPGTSGKIGVEVDIGDSEVDVNYEIKLSSVTGSFPTNLKFYKKYDESTKQYSEEITDITAEGVTGTISYDAEESLRKQDVQIYWVWPYESGNDATDTTEGQAAATTSFNILVTGTQAENK